MDSTVLKFNNLYIGAITKNGCSFFICGGGFNVSVQKITQTKFLERRLYYILIHKAAKKAFDELKLDKLPSIKRLNSEYTELLSAKKANYAEYVKLQKEVREMLLHKQNYEYILGIETDKKEKDDRTRNIEK